MQDSSELPGLVTGAPLEEGSEFGGSLTWSPTGEHTPVQM